MKTYFIGGSPCSGKSTVAEMLSEKYGFYYYKLDENIERHMKLAAKNNKPKCNAYFNMTSDQIWMRTPVIQFEDEAAIYREIFEYALSDIDNLNLSVPVITEGAGFMPELVKQANVGDNEYICIVPTSEFQITNYSKREWIPYVLEGCSDKKTAFNNWMDRDVLFAKYVADTADKLGFKCIRADGQDSPADMLCKVEAVFNL